MFFRAFGVPTTVQLSHFLGAVMFGFWILRSQYPQLIVIWMAIVFVSVLLHELGHAFAMRRYGLEPEITLYMFGGLTSTSSRGMSRLTRPQRIFISFAGPGMGFLFGGLVYLFITFVPIPIPNSELGRVALSQTISWLLFVNLGWGVLNLIPVSPLDGGHILEDVMGPRRERLTYKVMIVVAIAVSVLVLTYLKFAYFIIIIMGIGAYQAYQRLQMIGSATRRVDPTPAKAAEAKVPPEMRAKLQEAKNALADDRYDEAGTIAELILGEKPPKPARIEALHIIGWAHLLEDRPAEAERALKAIAKETEPDLALLGALLFHKDDQAGAREVFETARAAGDDRKEIVGPLIQILIGQGEVARAAAVALDVVETLSEDDARQMATIAYESDAYQWSARLHEAVFDRTDDPADAYEAARAMAMHGDVGRSLALLRRAVAAGYSDAGRVWSDKALEKLRSVEESELEAILPKADEG